MEASARRALEAIEARTLAGVAEILAGAIDRATDAIERLEAMSPDEWMTAEEAAAHLKRTPKAFEKVLAAGEIPKHYLTERGILFSQKELDEWLMGR